MNRLRIIVKGTVQGVGFRPFIYNLARGLGLKGFVTNTSRGVIIEVEGEAAGGFPDTMQRSLPPLARVEAVSAEQLPPHGYEAFTIIESRDEGSFTHVSPDMAICDDCLREMLDPGDRRFLYPFINCTNCGPRYSITRHVPYDRPNTTMAPFIMCPQCRAEYDDPADRRFHAQPNACPICGPNVDVIIPNSQFKASTPADPIAGVVALLKGGAIVAVKGLGGFHLCCDAENRAAVERLRERKRKSNKPFALMAPDVATIRNFCEVSDDEERVLLDQRRPIVLLAKRHATDLPEALAPRNRSLGFMLPYTPLHYLLFFHGARKGGDQARPHFRALVATSGNISEEPIVIDNREALEKLSPFADAFLFHNRDIFMRVDDSVVRVQRGTTLFIRRSRGFAPEAVLLDSEGPEVLGCGAEVKNTFTITKGNAAVMSQHIGDMENLETLNFFEETLANLKQVYRCEPKAIAYDLHPGYLATRWAEAQIAAAGLAGFGIQHHYAHIASVMAEHGIREPVLGIALDGTGYGTDGTIWGSEFLRCDLDGFQRLGHFKPLPLPGGEQSIREPWRIAVAWLAEIFAGEELVTVLGDIGFLDRFGRQRIDAVLRIAGNRRFTPLSAGAGRYFDAVAALLGICDMATFEGEAAIALESLLVPPDKDSLFFHERDSCASGLGLPDTYSYAVSNYGDGIQVIDFEATLRRIVEEIRGGVPATVVSMRFHETIAHSVCEMAGQLASSCRINSLALSGGCFQNAFLLNRVSSILAARGLSVLSNEKVPCNDACMSLGHAFLARERFRKPQS